jgi:PST family polysaccharide transporter
VQGEVSDAFIVALTASTMTSPGLLHYLVAKPKAGPEVGWNITVVHIALGAIALGLVVLFRDPLGDLVGAPHMGPYVPGFALALLLERIGQVPERVLARRMEFRPIGVTRTATEIVYSVTSVALACMHFGGMAIVWGNIARNLLYAFMLIRAAERKDWLTPSPIKMDTLKPVFAFGLPLFVGALATFASRRWDNLLISKMFGIGVVGLYNQAYNLADIPAIQVGEQIGEVLLPSFSNMEPEQRKDALVRSTGLLALIIFPLAIGLGAIADSLVAPPLFGKGWAGAAPMLAILSALSVVRPFGFTIASYLQASNLPRAQMWLNLSKLVLLAACIVALGQLGPLWACGGVGVAFGFQSFASMVVVGRLDGIPVGAFMRRCLPPLLACAPLVGGVLGARWLLARVGVEAQWIKVLSEICAGGLGYLVAAPILARSEVKEIVGMIERTIQRRRGKAD